MKGNPFPTIYALARVQQPATAPPYLWRDLQKWKVTMHRDGTCLVGNLSGESTGNLHAVELVVDGLRLMENPEGRQVKIRERDYQRLLRSYAAFYNQITGAYLTHTGNAKLDPPYQVVTCRRCGGEGRHSFNLVHADMCYGCGGTGRMVVDSKQRPLKATATLDTAHAGDILAMDFVLYLVEEIRWIAYQARESGSINQTVTVRRMIDAHVAQHERLGWVVDPSQFLLVDGKEVYGGVRVSAHPTEDIIGQLVQGPGLLSKEHPAEI